MFFFFALVCSAPLGMENKDSGEISNSQIQTAPASSGSHDNPRLRHSYAYISEYHWTPFIQVDLGPASKLLTAVAVQGRAYGHNTWSFYMKYSEDGSEWYNYTENGVTRVSEITQWSQAWTKFKLVLIGSIVQASNDANIL